MSIRRNQPPEKGLSCGHRDNPGRGSSGGRHPARPAPQAPSLRSVVARRPRAGPRGRQVDAADHPRSRGRPAALRGAPARAPGHLDRAAALAPEPDGGRRPAHAPALPRGAAARGLRADRALARADARARRARALGLRLDVGRPAPGRGRQHRRDLPPRARDARAGRRTSTARSSWSSTRAASCPSAASSSRSTDGHVEITERDRGRRRAARPRERPRVRMGAGARPRGVDRRA